MPIDKKSPNQLDTRNEMRYYLRPQNRENEMKRSAVLCASIVVVSAAVLSAGASFLPITGPAFAIIGPSMTPTESTARTQTNAAVSKINQDPQMVARVAKFAASKNTQGIHDLMVQNGAPSELVITKASSPPKGGVKRIKVSCKYDVGPPWKLSCSLSW